MTTATAFPRKLLKSSQVREALGYADNASFWKSVHANGVPHIRLNARHILFDEAAVVAWLASRTVGKSAA